MVNNFVVDTNVIVSAAVFSSITPALCLTQIASKGNLVFSESVLQEYAEILSDNKFDKFISLEKGLLFLEKLIANGALISVHKEIRACRDFKDDNYLELAVSCNATCTDFISSRIPE